MRSRTSLLVMTGVEGLTGVATEGLFELVVLALLTVVSVGDGGESDWSRANEVSSLEESSLSEDDETVVLPDSLMGMIVWEEDEVSMKNRLVKKPVTEERTLVVLSVTLA